MTLNYTVQVKIIVASMSDKLPVGMFGPAINLSRKFSSLLVRHKRRVRQIKNS